MAVCWALRVFLGLLINEVCSEFVWKHHSNEELPLVLEEIHEKCPNITRVYALSETSVQNVPLYVIELTLDPGVHQPCKYLYYLLFIS